MTFIRISIFAALCTLISLSGEAQSYNIGIRAGLNQSKLTGPVDPNFGEKRGLSGGFHFGVNFQWNFNEIIGIRSEVLYTQAGGTYEMESPNGFYVFDLPNAPSFVLRDTSRVKLEMSNAYIQFPQTLHVKVSEKIELFAGAYVGLLINPVATGTIEFGGPNFTQEHSFIQGLNFNYFSDRDPQNGFFNRGTAPILIRVQGQDDDIPSIVNSQDLWNNGAASSRFLSVDYGLIGGATYYINRGLYVMGRVEFGGRDITRNSTDYSFKEVNDSGALVYDSEKNKHLGIAVSLGFRF